MDELISDKEEDWFTYDDESLNFLMKNENLNYEVDIYNNIYSPEEDKIYFQDKLPYTVLSSKEYKKVFLRIVLKEVRLLDKIVRYSFICEFEDESYRGSCKNKRKNEKYEEDR